MPTYKLLNGIPGQSYAIELAERMGLSSEIIQKQEITTVMKHKEWKIFLKITIEKILVNEEYIKQQDLTQN